MPASPQPQPSGGATPVIAQDFHGADEAITSLLKAGATWGQVGKATVSTDRLNGACGRSGGALQDCNGAEVGGPLSCWPASHIAGTVGELSLGASESSHSTAMVGLEGQLHDTLPVSLHTGQPCRMPRKQKGNRTDQEHSCPLHKFLYKL